MVARKRRPLPAATVWTTWVPRPGAHLGHTVGGGAHEANHTGGGGRGNVAWGGIRLWQAVWQNKPDQWWPQASPVRRRRPSFGPMGVPHSSGAGQEGG